ncbi:hypothetical protein GGX14DRAFT_564880 [Mycena pura]|uniref:Uncharacterized protein n=1 Tax=Mycena pura TaxID=153505 RepID=A0AAD6VN59_9AGAR|nr:hypothetical protein GGX14DRAFT_564880 [Mycena pura]
MPLSRRATPHPDAPHEPLFLADPDDDSNYPYPMLMSPSQAPAHITRDIGIRPAWPLDSVPSSGLSSTFARWQPSDPSRPSALPGPAQGSSRSRGSVLSDSLPLSSGSLVLPPLTPRNVRWSSPLVTPPQLLAPRSPPRRVPSLARMAVSDPRTGLPLSWNSTNPFVPASTPSPSSSDSSSSSSSSESSSESDPEPGSPVYSSDHSPPPVTAPPPHVSLSPPAPLPAPSPPSVEDEAHAAQVRANRERFAREFDEQLARADSPEPGPALEFEELGGPEFLYAPQSPLAGDDPDFSAGSPAPERDSSASPPPQPTAASTASRSSTAEPDPDSESSSESDSGSDSSSESSRPRKRRRLLRHPRSASTDSVVSRAVSATADELFPPDEESPTPPPSVIKVAPAPATKRQTLNSQRAAGLIPSITVLPPSSAAPDSDGPEPARRGRGRPKGSLNKRTLAKASSATPVLSSARAKRRPTPRHIEPPAGTEMAGPLPITGDAPTKLGPFVSAQTVPPIDVDGLERVLAPDIPRPFLDGCDFCLVRDVRCDKAAAQLELARASYQQFERSQRILGEAMAQLRYGYGNERGVAYAAEIAPVQRDEFAEFWVAGELSLPPRPPPAPAPAGLSRRTWAREPSSYFLELDERNVPAVPASTQPAGDSGQGPSQPRRERFFSLTPSNDSEPEEEDRVER